MTIELPITVPPLEGPELFIGIVGPLGIDLTAATQELVRGLAGVGYEGKQVRMSALLMPVAALATKVTPEPAFEDERIEVLMDAGDEHRRRAGSGAALVHLAIAKVRDLRAAGSGGHEKPLHRTAYIFNSLKHPEEVKELRRVYGAHFVVISFYQPRSARIDELCRRIERSRGGRGEGLADRAIALIDKDARGGDPKYGQNVGDVFPQADLFARAEDGRGSLASDVDRCIRVLFSDPFCTPTRDEYCMFLARAAALRSADLSRQVGAVIANPRGDVVASGCNEVPRPAGGNYWPDDVPDRRDFRLGKDPNALMKRDLVQEVLEVLAQRGWLCADKQELASAERAEQALQQALFEGSRVDNIIEFGRVVHAEMNALMDAVRRGVALEGHTLYCTTFPCHLCARHLIGAGIRRVVFIEPYPKSLVKQLYEEAVALENEHADERAVRFEPFVGVAPRTYMSFFSRGRRKDPAGYADQWDRPRAQPHVEAYYASYLEVEQRVCDSLDKLAPSLGLEDEPIATPATALVEERERDE